MSEKEDRPEIPSTWILYKENCKFKESLVFREICIQPGIYDQNFSEVLDEIIFYCHFPIFVYMKFKFQMIQTYYTVV